MDSNTLTALSPLDGRYHEKVSQLRDIFSEQGLIQFRTHVEVRWLEMLAEHGNLAEMPRLSPDARKILIGIIE